MKNRILSIILTVTVISNLIVALPSTVSAATSGTCGGNLTWTLDNAGILTISGTGAMDNYKAFSSPWCIKDDVISVIIENGVTSIGDYAFYWCDSIRDISIPQSVTSIGDYAFYWCNSLRGITIPESVTNIGNFACFGCSALSEISTAENNSYYTSIDGVLYNKDMTTLVQYPAGKTDDTYLIPNSVTSIGCGAFGDCNNLKKITIPNGVTNIEKFAFEGCSSITEITIPKSVTSIGHTAFGCCNNLKKVIIKYGVTSIGNYAFIFCSSLNEITIPHSITSIGDGAFGECYSLTDVCHTGTEDKWAQITIGEHNEYLTGATMHHNYAEPKPQMSDISYTLQNVGESNNLVVDFSVENVSQTAIIYGATYSETGKFLEVKELTLNDGRVSGNFSATDVYEIKAFILDGANCLKPYCENKSVIVN